MASDEHTERMQALLRHMSQRSSLKDRMTAITNGIANTDDDSDQYTNLTELCTTLNMLTEEVLGVIRPDQLVPPIVECLRKEYNVELMLMAARALTYLIEIIPPSVAVVSSVGGITVLCDRLRNIQEIELAEQCLSALEKAAAEQPAVVLKEAAVPAMLGFIDFFNISVQRKTLTAVANLCKRVTKPTFSCVAPSIPQLKGYIQHEDQKIAEQAITALTRILQGVRGDEACVVEVLGNDLVSVTLAALSTSSATSSMGVVFSSVVKLMQVMVAASVTAVEMLLIGGVMEMLIDLLSGEGRDLSTSPSPSTLLSTPPSRMESFQLPPSPLSPQATPLDSTVGSTGTPPTLGRPRAAMAGEQLSDVLTLACLFLPAVQDGFMLYISKGRGLSSSAASSGAKGGKLTDLLAGLEDEDNDDDDDDVERRLASVHRGVIEHLMRSHQLPIENKQEKVPERGKRHTCDGCHKMLTRSDWFRCNGCNDLDYCTSCFLGQGMAHARSDRHAFTDVGHAGPAPDASREPKPAKELKPEHCQKRALYEAQPDLLVHTLGLIAATLKLYEQSEVFAVKNTCLDIAARAVHFATPEMIQLVISETPLGSHLASMLSSTDIRTTAFTLHIAENVVQKAPECVQMLAREGVVSALSIVKTSVAEIPETLPPLHELTASEEGWRTVLSYTAARILSSFQGAEQSGVEIALSDIRELFRAGSWREGLERLLVAITEDQGVSTYELANSGVVSAMVDYLKHSKVPEAEMLTLMVVLGQRCQVALRSPTHGPRSPRSEQQTVSGLNILVGHLQALLTQHEAFPVQNKEGTAASAMRTLTQHIRLNLVQQKDEASGDKEKEKDSKRPGLLGRDRGNVAVMIEPLATIAAVIDFISSRLLKTEPKEKRGTAAEEDEDVEDLAEEEPGSSTNSTPTTASPGKQRDATRRLMGRLSSATFGSDQSVYVRLGNHEIPPGMNIMQAMLKYGACSKDAATGNLTLNSSCTLHYSNKPFGEEVNSVSKAEATATPVTFVTVAAELTTRAALDIRTALQSPLAVTSSVDLRRLLQDCLVMLQVTYTANVNWPSLADYGRMYSLCSEEQLADVSPVEAGEFINQRITSKVARQTFDPMLIMSGQLSSNWCYNLCCDCPFLTPFSCRRNLLEMAFLGPARSLMTLQERISQESGGNQQRENRVQRQKFRVRRDKAFESAKRVMERYGPSRAIFEFEFADEVGSGLGPTQEFYTIVSHEAMTKGVGLWRGCEEAGGTETDSSAFVDAQFGVFPRLTAGQTTEKQRRQWRFVGYFLGRLVLDRRIGDVPLSAPLVRALQGKPLCLEDMALVSDGAHRIARAILEADARHEDTILLNSQRCAPGDLGITFAVPGLEGVALKEGGEDIAVDATNMKEFADLLLRFMLGSAVDDAVQTIRVAFDELVAVDSLSLFAAAEVDLLLRGEDDPITMDDLDNHTLCDHGFTHSSKPVRFFFETICEMPTPEQRQLIQFLTGAPKLPIGGLQNLRPKLTVVRKTVAEDPSRETQQLPSVMTCQNFVKLPAYDTKEQLAVKLRQAIDEGSGVFSFT